MNISHEWLKAFVPHALTAEQLRDLMTAHVATVEGFERTRAELEPFVVAQVIESERIPETRLSFNKVDDGSGTLLEVVCGAPNVTVGAKYPFARSGTTMPGGMLIERRKIRGFASNGMLCSPRELGLGDDHDGILELRTDAPTGTPLLEVMPLSDVRLVMDVLPNRPDLLSHQGVARDVAAVTGVATQLPPELTGIPATPTAMRGDTSAVSGGVSVRLESVADCPRYCAVVIRDSPSVQAQTGCDVASRRSGHARSITWWTRRTMCCMGSDNRCMRSICRNWLATQSSCVARVRANR